MKQIYGREAVEAYEEFDARFVICARKTPRLVEQLRQAEWKPSPNTDADAECEFRYQPEGWSRPYRFVALRYEKSREQPKQGEPEQLSVVKTQSSATRCVRLGDNSNSLVF